MVLLKRTLISAVAFILVFTLGAALYSFFAPTPEQERKAPQRAAATKAKAWDGQRVKLYNTTFVRATDQIKITQIQYSNLQTEATDVAVTLVVAPGTTGETPAWLTPKAFQVRAANSQRVFTPRVRITPQGQTTTALIKLTGLPTTGLGDVCEGAPTGPTDALNLRVYGPNGVFEIQLLPPAAPAGHCFSAKVALPSECATSQTKLDSINAAAKARTKGIAKAKNKTRARLVKEDKAADKADKEAKAPLNDILESPRCNPPVAAKGHKLTSAEKKQDRAAYYAGLGIEDPQITKARAQAELDAARSAANGR